MTKNKKMIMQLTEQATQLETKCRIHENIALGIAATAVLEYVAVPIIKCGVNMVTSAIAAKKNRAAAEVEQDVTIELNDDTEDEQPIFTNDTENDTEESQEV